MEQSKNYLQWTREEFMVYVMSYASRLDIIHHIEEKKFIREHAALKDYLHIQKEIQGDSDIDALEKITEYAASHQFSMLDKDLLLAGVNQMFKFNNEQTAMENGILSMLHKVFS